MRAFSKKTKSRIAESEHAATHKKQLALFLQLTGLIKVSEFGFFGEFYLLVWVGLVIELERIISVHEVLLRLFFDFSVALNLIKKLCAVTRVFGSQISRLDFRRFLEFGLHSSPRRDGLTPEQQTMSVT